jgi:hypothetical protein
VVVPLPPSFADTRAALQRVATHVVARRRHGLAGRFGLRATPGGFGMPAAGPDHEVLRTAGTWLVRERTGAEPATSRLDLTSASLADAAAFAEVDLGQPFEAGHDTPALGDLAAPLGVAAEAADVLAGWWALGWTALDAAVGALPAPVDASIVQLWPEHFDAACDVAAGSSRANLGASPGDAGHDEPYLYVGPWGDERPGPDGYWNAPFGAVLGRSTLLGAGDPLAAAVAFLSEGLRRLG